MIITHAQSQDGYRRIYLGAKFSLECWIEPKDDGRGWTFHYDASAGASHMAPGDMRCQSAPNFDPSSACNVDPSAA